MAYFSKRDYEILYSMQAQSICHLFARDTDYSVDEFENLVRSGSINDDNTFVKLVINGEVRDEFNIFIDNRCVLKSGSIISFWGILKSFKNDEIRIKLYPRINYDYENAI